MVKNQYNIVLSLSIMSIIILILFFFHIFIPLLSILYAVYFSLPLSRFYHLFHSHQNFHFLNLNSFPKSFLILIKKLPVSLPCKLLSLSGFFLKKSTYLNN